MARVTITEITPGSQRLAATANASLSSWNTNSTGIDEVNFRAEAFDERSLKKEFHKFGTTTPVYAIDGVIQAIVSVVWAQVAGPFHIGPFDFTSGDDEIVVRLSVEAYGALVAPGDDEISIGIGYKTGALGVATVIPETERPFLFRGAPVAVHRNITISHRYAGITNANLWFTLMAKVSAAVVRNWDLRNGVLTATMYKR